MRSALQPKPLPLRTLSQQLQSASFSDLPGLWAEASIRNGDADICLVDRFFLLTQVLHRPDAMHPWVYARCREVEAAPDGYIDIWAREHYKSTVITFAGVIQEIIRDAEITIGLFSHTKPIAKGFVVQIKREFETNNDLRSLFPELCWVYPDSEAPMWSESAIVLRRQ